MHVTVAVQILKCSVDFKTSLDFPSVRLSRQWQNFHFWWTYPSTVFSLRFSPRQIKLKRWKKWIIPVFPHLSPGWVSANILSLHHLPPQAVPPLTPPSLELCIQPSGTHTHTHTHTQTHTHRWTDKVKLWGPCATFKNKWTQEPQSNRSNTMVGFSTTVSWWYIFMDLVRGELLL